MSRHTLIVAGRDLTGIAAGLQWSTVDPGGCEAASFTVPDAALRPNLGDKALIFVGNECVFHGRVEESGQTHTGRHSSGRVTCIGAGAELKDGTMSEVYVDRDMAKFTTPAVTRLASLVSSGYNPNVANAHLRPSSPTDGHGYWVTFQGVMNWPISELIYDAGPDNKVGHVVLGYMSLIRFPTSDSAVFVEMEVWDDAGKTGGSDTTGNLRTSSGTTDIRFTPSTPRRFLALQHHYDWSGGGSAGVEYGIRWQELQIYGNHGLPRRDGSWYGERGLYPQDIVRHALQHYIDSGYGKHSESDVQDALYGLRVGVIDDSVTFRVLHAVYQNQTPHEQIVDDMAVLMGYHWGVWPAPGLKGGTEPAELHWRPRPTDATCVVSRLDCEAAEFTQRLADVHNYYEVYYTDGGGVRELAFGSRQTARMPDGMVRALVADLGMGNSASAHAWGRTLLALEDQALRGGGPVTLPTYVQSRGGGRIPSALLKAGLDRLRIADLPNAGPINETDTRRFDTFRIKRTETTADDRTGALKTTVELDAGANLLETLNARIQHSLAAQGIGLGGGGA